MVTLFTTRYNIQKFYMVLTLCLCVVYRYQNKQWLLPYTTLRDWVCITEVERVYCAVRTESFYETDIFHHEKVNDVIVEGHEGGNVRSACDRDISPYPGKCSIYWLGKPHWKPYLGFCHEDNLHSLGSRGELCETGQERGHLPVEPNPHGSPFIWVYWTGYLNSGDRHSAHFDTVFMTGLSGCSSLTYLHPTCNGLAALPTVDIMGLQNPLEHQFISARLQTVFNLHKGSIPGTSCTTEICLSQN